MKISYPLVTAVGIVLFFSLLPLIPQFQSGNLTVVNPRYLEGYYSPMTREVADGFPLLGNPYFFEHRTEVAPAFILPFWISAAPLLLGAPLLATVAFNFTLWSLVFVGVIYVIFRKLDFSRIFSAAASLILYLHMQDQILRPVSMQIVHPSFVIFLLALLLWLERPRHFIREMFLAFSAAFAIYAYTYQLQIIAVFLILAFAHLLYQKDGERIRSACIVGAWTAIFCIPFLIITLFQIQNPDYIDSMIRIGLGYTRWPAKEAYITAARILSLVALAWMLWVWVYKRNLAHARFYFNYMLLGIAIVVVSFMNVITGMDLETASHAARFVLIWLALGSVVGLPFTLIGIGGLSTSRKVVLAIVAGTVLFMNAAYITTPKDMFSFSIAREQIKSGMSMMRALSWLEGHIQEPSVIWVEPHSELGTAVPLYTKHYVLFVVQGALQLVSSEEVQERYLLASSLSDASYETIRDDLGLYGMNGYRVDTPFSINRGVRMCLLLQLSRLGFECGNLTTTDELYTPLYEKMYTRYIQEIVPNMQNELAKFHVGYIMKDKLEDKDFSPERLENARLVYSDDRFEIYKVN